MIRNKKGFSLVELVTVIGVIAVLSGLLAPSLISSLQSSNTKTDEAALKHLETTIQMAFQHNSVYKNAKKVADSANDDAIRVVYKVDANHMLILDSFETMDEMQGHSTSRGNNSTGIQLANIYTIVNDYINGKMDPIELQSDYYKELENYCFTITFHPDVDFDVDVELGHEYQQAQATGGIGAPGVYGGAYSQNGSWILPPTTGGTQLHLHTGYGGLESNKSGDIWKVTLTGDNLSEMSFVMSYLDTDDSWPNGGGTILNVKQTTTSYEIYVQSNVSSNSLAFCFRNDGNNTATVTGAQFVKVDKAP